MRQRLPAGEEVDPFQYHFRTVPEFIAPTGPYDWRIRSLFNCAGTRCASGIRLWVWRVFQVRGQARWPDRGDRCRPV